MKLNRPLLAAGYLTAILLIAIPFSEAIMAAWPIRITETPWRFGSTGILSRALMTPLLGLFVAAALAVAANHRRALWTLGLGGAVLSLLLIVTAPVFVLDVLEMRSRVRPQAARLFDSATVTALAKILAGALVSGLLATGCIRAARSLKRTPPPARAPASQGRSSCTTGNVSAGEHPLPRASSTEAVDGLRQRSASHPGAPARVRTHR